MDEAGPLLEELIGYYNDQRRHAETEEIPRDRWERAVRQDRSRLREVPAGVDLSLVFAIHVPRVVKADRTISFAGSDGRWARRRGKA